MLLLKLLRVLILVVFWHFNYDLMGRLIEKTEAGCQKTSYTYDANNNVLTKVEVNSAQWTYVYDEAIN